MKLNTSAIPFIVAFIVVAAGIYWYFFTGTGNQAPLSVDESENQAQVQFQTLVSELTPISFNTKIFSDSRFNALVDLSTPIAPESSGRLDPFAVVAGVSGTIK
ncbi:MAG: hypothetical protein NTY93_00185 [Candidatus Kaiserbacteria bacterium]|nr:hypothetical protein [Candidatus Kaiserbacteria bacterium]